MTCNECREFVHASLDGELEAGRQEVLEGHLAGCEKCRRYSRVFTAQKWRLGDVSQEAVAPESSSRVELFINTLAKDAPPRRCGMRGRPSFIWATAAAVLIAFAVFAGMALFAPSDTLADSTLREFRLLEGGRLVLDSLANCCSKVDSWFQAQVHHPVGVPKMNHDGIKVEGGKLYRHATGKELFHVICRFEGEPVSLFVCIGPNFTMPEGPLCSCCGRAVVTRGDDYTMLTWKKGEVVFVLVSNLDVDQTQKIFSFID